MKLMTMMMMMVKIIKMTMILVIIITIIKSLFLAQIFGPPLRPPPSPFLHHGLQQGPRPHRRPGGGGHRDGGSGNHIRPALRGG